MLEYNSTVKGEMRFMTTDTAQVYKAKLIEITKKISDIESLGFNTEKLKEELIASINNS